MSGRAPLSSIISNTYTYNPITGKILIHNGGGGSEVQTVQNEGTGEFLVDNTDPLNPKIKSLISGTNITIVDNGNDLTINSGVDGVQTVDNSPGHIGTGILVDNSNPDAQNPKIKALETGTGISFVLNPNDIIINNDGVININNEGLGTISLVDNITTGIQFPKVKTLINGNGINMVDNGLDITINSTTVPGDINYSLTDPSNSKVDIYGLTSDFSSNTRLLVGQSPNNLDYTDNDGNSMLITNTGISLDTEQYYNILNSNTDTNLTNNHVLIQNLPNNGNPTNSTNDYIVMTNQAMNLHVENQSNNNSYTFLHMESNLVSLRANTTDNTTADIKVAVFNQPDTTTYPTLAKSGIQITNSSIVLGSENTSLNKSAVIAQPTELSLLSNGNIILQADTSMVSTTEFSPGIYSKINQTIPNIINSVVSVGNDNGVTDLAIDHFDVAVSSTGKTSFGSWTNNISETSVNLVAKDNATLDNTKLNLQTNQLSLYQNYNGNDYGFGVLNDLAVIDLNSTVNGNLKIVGLQNQTYTKVLIYDQSSELVGFTPMSTFSNVVLTGTGVHQFTSGGSGTLNFRGMLSPLNTISFNPTATDIEMDVNFPTIPDMQPTVSGLAYGLQSAGNQNVLGNNNNSFVTRGNCIGQDLPSSLTGDKSNVISSINTLQSTNNILESNVLISGDGSEIPNTNRSNIIGQGFNNGNTDYDHCTYIGDMVNTNPSTLSTCFNSNIGGQNIVMNKESAYFGAGWTNITVNNNECHFDYKAPGLFYHDLAQATTANTLYFDNSTSKITWDTAPVSANPTLINWQNPDLNIGNNSIQRINSADVGPTSLVSCGTNICQVAATTGTIQLNSPIINAPLLNSATSTDVIYYNTVSKNMTHGVLPTNPNSTLINFQTTDANIGNNTITKISAADATTTSSITCTAGNLAVHSTGPITFDSNNIQFTTLPSASKTNVVYYDTSTKQISYSPPIVVPLIADVNAYSVPPSSSAVLLYALTIPANTFTTPGQSIRFMNGGTIVNTSGAPANATFIQTANATTLTPGLAVLASNGTTIWKKTGTVTLISVAGTNGTFSVDTNIGYSNNVVLPSANLVMPINANITINLSFNTAALLTVNQSYAKAWLE